MMRRRSSHQQLDIDDDPSTTPLNNADYGSPTTCYGIDDAGDSLGGWDPETGDGPPASDPATSAAAHHQPWSAADSMDSTSAAAAASCISVRMSILHELCSPSASVGPDLHRHRESKMNPLLWRNYPATGTTWTGAEEGDEWMATASGRRSPASSSDPGVGLMEEGEGEEGGAGAERDHEERRILERFASFPSGRGTSSPRNGRRKNKRKGTDSPRQTPAATHAPPRDDESNTRSAGPSQRQLLFDLTQLHDHEAAHEPVISHGMRPARGWASLDIRPDEEDEVTVSPRLLSPEMDEPSGSLHIQRFANREPQERRTTFLSLGGLRHSSGGGAGSGIGIGGICGTEAANAIHCGRIDSGPGEHPATPRAKQLVQQICSLKEKVKLYEDAFEARYGYRPSHHQKMDDRSTKRILTELARARKDLKQLKERYHLADVEPGTFEAGDSSSGGSADSSDAPPPSASFYGTANASVEQTVVEIQQHLSQNRQLAGRPEAVEELSSKEVMDEKLAVQRALLYVESLHGRPASFRHKDLLRPLYDRYRILKRMVVRSGLSRSKEEIGAELAPILEHETLELSQTRPLSWHRHSAPATPSLESMDDPQSSFGANRSDVQPRHEAGSWSSWASGDAADADKELVVWKRQKISLNIEQNLHALPLNQLVEQMRNVREEKRRLRRTIRETEADLLRKGTAGSGGAYSSPSSSQKEDDPHGRSEPLTLEPIYAQYRHARAKLRLLEALVAKHDGSATL